jgi:MerR family mercuric resistance operon transcriptional regulator
MADPATLTIGRFARAAGVGVETIRYYQQRGLLPVPRSDGAYRHYPAHLAGRIRFVKRAQELGFALDEIAGLLRLEDGTDRVSIRRIASARLEQIDTKLADQHRMHDVLRHLLVSCEHARADLPYPIIATLAQGTRRQERSVMRRQTSLQMGRGHQGRERRRSGPASESR